MKSLLSFIFVSMAITGAAQAHGPVSCDVPKAERRAQVDLQKKLESEGWAIRKLQIYNGCYEVYGYDEKEKQVEAFFNPKTFERVMPLEK